MTGLVSVLTISDHCIVSTLQSSLLEIFTPPFRISRNGTKMDVLKAHNCAEKFWLGDVWIERQTGQAFQKQLIGPQTSTLVKVGHHIQGKLLFKKRMTTDDAEVVQVNPGDCVQRNQHISAHFFNRLQKRQTNKGVGKKKKSPKLSDSFYYLFSKSPLKSVFRFHHCVVSL